MLLRQSQIRFVPLVRQLAGSKSFWVREPEPRQTKVRRTRG